MPTKIQWCDETLNPITGCSHAPRSRGCDHCYSERLTGTRLAHLPKYAGLTNERGHWTGEVRWNPEELEKPTRWRKPRRIFVNSMSDTFHDDVSNAWIDHIFATAAVCQQHTFILLTKRAQRMAEYMESGYEYRGVGSVVEILPVAAGEEYKW